MERQIASAVKYASLPGLSISFNIQLYLMNHLLFQYIYARVGKGNRSSSSGVFFSSLVTWYFPQFVEPIKGLVVMWSGLKLINNAVQWIYPAVGHSARHQLINLWGVGSFREYGHKRNVYRSGADISPERRNYESSYGLIFLLSGTYFANLIYRTIFKSSRRR